MARKPADLYVKEVAVNGAGAAVRSQFYAVYDAAAAPHPEEITQQAFSAAQARGAECVIRLKVPARVEIIRCGA